MLVHLMRGQCLAICDALGSVDKMKQVVQRINEAMRLNQADVIVIEGRIEGWRAVCDVLDEVRELQDASRLIRLQTTAVESQM